MPKVLIVEPTVVRYEDDRGGVHAEVAELCDVSKDVARQLVDAGRALYTSRKDDPTREGRLTASERMLEGAAAMRKARDQAAVEAAEAADTAAGKKA